MDRPDHDGNGVLTTASQAYNLANQLTTATDPLGRITSYVYDTLGELDAVTLPDPDGAGPLAAPVYAFAPSFAFV